jgi:hypothetical protein
VITLAIPSAPLCILGRLVYGRRMDVSSTLFRPWCSDCDAPVEEARVVRAARHGSVLIEARCHGKTRTAEMPVRALQARPPRPVQEAAAPC